MSLVETELKNQMPGLQVPSWRAVMTIEDADLYSFSTEQPHLHMEEPLFSVKVFNMIEDQMRTKQWNIYFNCEYAHSNKWHLLMTNIDCINVPGAMLRDLLSIVSFNSHVH